MGPNVSLLLTGIMPSGPKNASLSTGMMSSGPKSLSLPARMWSSGPKPLPHTQESGLRTRRRLLGSQRLGLRTRKGQVCRQGSGLWDCKHRLRPAGIGLADLKTAIRLIGKHPLSSLEGMAKRNRRAIAGARESCQSRINSRNRTDKTTIKAPCQVADCFKEVARSKLWIFYSGQRQCAATPVLGSALPWPPPPQSGPRVMLPKTKTARRIFSAPLVFG